MYRISIQSIIKAIIVTIAFLFLGYTKLLSDRFEFFKNIPEELLLILIILCVILSLIFLETRLSLLFFFQILIVVLGVSVGVLRVYNRGGDNNFWLALPYYYIILSIPILTLLKNGWKLENLLNTIYYLSMGAYMFRIYISLFYTITGRKILESIYREGAMENWIRNGILRLNPPFSWIIIVPICYFFIAYGNTRKYRIKGVVGIGIALYYSIFVHVARGASLYQVLTIAAMFMYQKVSDKKKLLKGCFIIIAIIVVVNSSYFQRFVDSFSISNKQYGVSSSGRLLELKYYGGLYLKSPVWGLGNIRGHGIVNNRTVDLSDVGVLYSIVRYGLPLLFFYIITFAKGFYISSITRRNMSSYSSLVFGMTLSIMITGINMDCFFTIWALVVPFYLAIVEYIKYDYESNFSNHKASRFIQKEIVISH